MPRYQFTRPTGMCFQLDAVKESMAWTKAVKKTGAKTVMELRIKYKITLVS